MAKKKQSKKKTSNKKIEEIEEIKEEVTEEVEPEEIEEAEEVKEEKPTKKKRNDSKKNKDADKKAKSENKSHWFKDFKGEIKKIVWPSGKRLFDNVVVVLSMVIVVTLIIFLLDLGLKQLSNLEVNGVNELKTKVANELNSVNNNVTTSDDILVNGTDGSVTTVDGEASK